MSSLTQHHPLSLSTSHPICSTPPPFVSITMQTVSIPAVDSSDESTLVARAHYSKKRELRSLIRTHDFFPPVQNCKEVAEKIGRLEWHVNVWYVSFKAMLCGILMLSRTRVFSQQERSKASSYPTEVVPDRVSRWQSCLKIILRESGSNTLTLEDYVETLYWDCDIWCPSKNLLIALASQCKCMCEETIVDQCVL